MIVPSSNTNLGKEITCNDDNIILKIKVISESAIISKRLLNNSIGIGYINEEIVKDDIKKGILYRLPLKTYNYTYSVDIAIQNKNNNMIIKEFIKCIKEVIKENEDNKL